MLSFLKNVQKDTLKQVKIIFVLAFTKIFCEFINIFLPKFGTFNAPIA